MKRWFEDPAMTNDIVISSRIRLARNLYAYPFSPKLSVSDSGKLVKEVREGFFSRFGQAENYFDFHEINALEDVERTAFVERHAISPLLAEKDGYTGVIVSKNEQASIMINEEDHIRIQTLAPGKEIEKTFEEANRLDDLFAGCLKYAYNQKYGYITACPTNLGTGLRVSYMVHLPLLESESLIKPLSEEMNRFGFTIRGIYGEGTKALGAIYQISNQKTLGISEEEILLSLENMVSQVTEQEKRLRDQALRKRHSEIEDLVYRAYGILKYARKISSEDAMRYLTNIRFGLCEGIIHYEGEGTANIFEMMIRMQPASLQLEADKTLGTAERDQYRAKYIREHLPDLV